MPVPVISIAQMRAWENATWKSGQSEAEVIRRVGEQVARLALQLTKSDNPIVVLAGRGNNGADAKAAVPHLAGRNVLSLDVPDPEAALPELETLLARKPALIVDGLFGIGLNRPLDSNWRRFIDTINAAQRPVLSIDVPSGLNAEIGEPEGASIEAAVTMTVGAPKRGLVTEAAARYVGRLEVADEVGLCACPETSEVLWTLPRDFEDFPPRRRVDSHKGSFGHLAILAGSHGYHGAGVLAARAAQRARPGLITLFPTEPAYVPCASQLQAVMVQPWSAGLKLPGHFDALLAGPGLAGAEIRDAFKEIINHLWGTADVPMVVDASALAWLSEGARKTEALRVMTPHPGEAARLLGISSSEIQSNRADAVRLLSKRFDNCWVILKGHLTLVGRSSGEIFLNSSGNPELAQGGSGDVLAGYLAGLLAQPALRLDPLKAIRFAVWQHGAAADALSRTRPNWVVEDLVSALGSAAS